MFVHKEQLERGHVRYLTISKQQTILLLFPQHYVLFFYIILTYKGNNGSERETGHHRLLYSRKDYSGTATSKGWRRRKYQINYGLGTIGEKEKRTSKENVDAAMTTRNLEPGQW